MDPSHGVGRALFSALDQFAPQSGHSELASAKLIQLDFSGTGALFAHFVGYAPDRVVASIPTDPEHHGPAGIDNVRLPDSALGVPERIMARGDDEVCGTERPYNYFRKYRDRGAPWEFLVQNKAPHGCIINTKSLMLAWLDEIIKVRHPSPTTIDVSRGWEGYIRACPSEVHDGWGSPTWNVCGASVQRVGETAPAQHIPAGWFPSRRLANQRLTFIQQPEHPTPSLP